MVDATSSSSANFEFAEGHCGFFSYSKSSSSTLCRFLSALTLAASPKFSKKSMLALLSSGFSIENNESEPEEVFDVPELVDLASAGGELNVPNEPKGSSSADTVTNAPNSDVALLGVVE